MFPKDASNVKIVESLAFVWKKAEANAIGEAMSSPPE